ncbi:hypothetical protein PLESTF_000270500 [Pleodorina starrii]|nr:hypothetical protein PLESTF_000270500 [Pleodorina starrii]
MRLGASRALGATCSAGRLPLTPCSSVPAFTAAGATGTAAASSPAPAPRCRLPPPPLPPPAALPPHARASPTTATTTTITTASAASAAAVTAAVAVAAGIRTHQCAPGGAASAASSAAASGSPCRLQAAHRARCSQSGAPASSGSSSSSSSSCSSACPPTTTAAAAAALLAAAATGGGRPISTSEAPSAASEEGSNVAAAAATTAATAAAAAGGGGGGGSAGAAAVSPQLPLCRRPAVHVGELGAALAWKAAMADRISRLGDSLELQDGGPDMAGLMRELDWVLDDVIEAVREAADCPWEETSWRLLEPRVRAEAHRRTDPRVTDAWQLRLREPLPRLWEWWERRLRDRVPFQYLLSSAHWHRYVLAVGPGVLVPRPETEIFPELVRTAISARPYLAAAPWADLGTGSGAIAIAAADELRRINPAAEVWAVDLSPAAVAYARFNVQICLYGNDTNPPSPPPPPSNAPGSVPAAAAAAAAGDASGGCLVRVVQGSWFEPLRQLRGRLGGVLSNPPYIPRREMAGLQAEVGRHEPAGALDGGEGPGLDSLQVLCSEAADMLAPGGLIALETAGGEQADLVAHLLRGTTETAAVAAVGTSHGSVPAAVSAFEEVEVLPDCYGVRRFVRAYRRRDEQQ